MTCGSICSGIEAASAGERIEIVESRMTPDETLRSGYDPERENEAPRRSAEWNRALGWVDALHDEARVWCEKGNTPATVNIVAESVNSAGLANERKQGEGCGK